MKKKFAPVFVATALGTSLVNPVAQAVDLKVSDDNVCTITYTVGDIASMKDKNAADFKKRLQAFTTTFDSTQPSVNALLDDLVAGTLTDSKLSNYKTVMADAIFPVNSLSRQMSDNEHRRPEVFDLLQSAIDGFNSVNELISDVSRTQTVTQLEAQVLSGQVDENLVKTYFLDNAGDDRFTSVLESFNKEAKDQSAAWATERKSVLNNCATAKPGTDTSVDKGGNEKGSAEDLGTGGIIGIVLGAIAAVAALLGIGGVATGQIKLPF